MMKLGGGGSCIIQKSQPRLNVGIIAPLGAHPQKCSVGLRHWENRCRLSSFVIKLLSTFMPLPAVILTFGLFTPTPNQYVSKPSYVCGNNSSKPEPIETKFYRDFG